VSAVSFLGDLLAALGKSFEPLQESLGGGETFSAFLADFGWSLDPGSNINAIQGALGKLPTDLATIPHLITALENANSGKDPAAIAAAVKDLETLIKDVVDTVHALGSTTPPVPPNPVWPSPLDSPVFWTTFPPDLLEFLFYRYLERYAPRLFTPLRLLGVLSEEYRVPTTAGRVAYMRRGVRWDRLIGAVSRPQDILTNVYGWGGKFEAYQLLGNIKALAIAYGLAASERDVPRRILDIYYDPSTQGLRNTYELSIPIFYEVTDIGPSLEMVTVELVVLPIPPADNKAVGPVGFALYPRVVGSAAAQFQLTPSVTAEIKGEFASEAAVRAEIRPSGARVAVDPGLSASIDAAAILDGKPAKPWIVLGRNPGTRLELSHVHLAMKAKATESDIELIAELAADAGALVLDFAEGDGFLKSVLHGSPQRMELAVGLTWSSKTGLRFNGQAGLEATIPVHQLIAGMLGIESLFVSFHAKTDGSGASLAVAASGGLAIGPIIATVDKVGLTLDLKPVATGQPAGNLGLANVGFSFKPPTGIGLAISAPGVEGVGFLDIDLDHNQYLGALALRVASVDIEAVGILTTKLPSGPGFSLVVLAAAGFPPVELGFGFDLVGLGGLIGINRTVNVPGIQALARSGGLDNLMFPADLKHNAPQVAASLATIFPPSQGHFVVGPAARISWGSHGILDAQIGVYVELSDSGGGITVLRVALLGWMHLTAPNAKAPVADITLDVLGVIDVAGKTLAIDAGLRKSTVAGFTLTGKAALRATWGDQPAFVLAIGGFNPHFAAPAGFPPLDRVAISLGGDNPRFRMSTYLALTSNKLQLGAFADLYAAAGPAAVAASLSFDALVQYKPFGLVIDLSMSASVLFDGSPLFSLRLDLHVIGPDPWLITGTASFQVFIANVTVPIYVQVGPSPAPQPALTVDLDGNLTAALLDLKSWRTGPPAGTGPVVVRSLDAAEPAVHPLGTLTVRQHAVPLGQRIVRYGPDLLTKPCTYGITGTKLALAPTDSAPVSDFFAPSQFRTMTDPEKLSSPSFEAMTSGFTMSPGGLGLPVSNTVPSVVVATPSTRIWNPLVLDSPDPAPGAAWSVVESKPAVAVPASLLATQLTGAATAVNGSPGKGAGRYWAQGSGIRLTQPTYAVVALNQVAVATTGNAPSSRIASYMAALGVMASVAPDQGPAQVVFMSEPHMAEAS
jgi:hypothetical protein